LQALLRLLRSTSPLSLSLVPVCLPSPETGSGKSTILDALCLALYGEYPRVSSPRQETAPDPGGSISVQDGRAILRRGAASGYAEADFVSHDGVSYRVRWEAHRARGRANGKLQNEQRLISRIDDGSAVASGKTPVREAVEKRTDLSFQQFRRTVLLAQGEFDAFLQCCITKGQTRAAVKKQGARVHSKYGTTGKWSPRHYWQRLWVVELDRMTEVV